MDWVYNDRLFKLVDTAGLTRITPVSKLHSAEASELMREDVKNITRIANEEAVRLKDSKLGSRISLPGVMLTNPQHDPSQYSYQISELALSDALNSLRFAQVVLLVVEGIHGRFNKIDLQLAAKCLKEGRALVVCANKRDLVTGVSAEEYEEGVRAHCRVNLKEFGEVRVVSCAALQKDNVNAVLEAVLAVHDAWSKRVTTWVLNRWLKDMMVSTPAPRAGGKAVSVKYITQIKTRPPTFALFCNAQVLPGFFDRFLRYSHRSRSLCCCKRCARLSL